MKKKADEVIVDTPTVVDADPLDDKPKVAYRCDRYPQLRVLVARRPAIDEADIVVQFVRGEYATSDAKEIAVLDNTTDVHRDLDNVMPCPYLGCSFTTTKPAALVQHMQDIHIRQ